MQPTRGAVRAARGFPGGRRSSPTSTSSRWPRPTGPAAGPSPAGRVLRFVPAGAVRRWIRPRVQAWRMPSPRSKPSSLRALRARVSRHAAARPTARPCSGPTFSTCLASFRPTPGRGCDAGRHAGLPVRTPPAGQGRAHGSADRRDDGPQRAELPDSGRDEGIARSPTAASQATPRSSNSGSGARRAPMGD